MESSPADNKVTMAELSCKRKRDAFESGEANDGKVDGAELKVLGEGSEGSVVGHADVGELLGSEGKLADGSVDVGKLPESEEGSEGKLANDSADMDEGSEGKLPDGSADVGKLLASEGSEGKVADGSVDVCELPVLGDGSEGKLADGSTDMGEILASQGSEGKLADGSVDVGELPVSEEGSERKLAYGADVDELMASKGSDEKVADGNADVQELLASEGSEGKLADGNVDVQELLASEGSEGKLADGNVDVSELLITDGSVNARELPISKKDSEGKLADVGKLPPSEEGSKQKDYGRTDGGELPVSEEVCKGNVDGIANMPSEAAGENNANDDDNLITCNKCSQTYHIKCLSPSLEAVPEDWKCPTCTDNADLLEPWVNLRRPRRERNLKPNCYTCSLGDRKRLATQPQHKVVLSKSLFNSGSAGAGVNEPDNNERASAFEAKIEKLARLRERQKEKVGLKRKCQEISASNSTAVEQKKSSDDDLQIVEKDTGKDGETEDSASKGPIIRGHENTPTNISSHLEIGSASASASSSKPKAQKKTKAASWTEFELDALWIGVRRHGEGNWGKILSDPNLGFGSRKANRDLSKRWEKEVQKILPPPANPQPPQPQQQHANSSNNNTTNVGGVVPHPHPPNMSGFNMYPYAMQNQGLTLVPIINNPGGPSLIQGSSSSSPSMVSQMAPTAVPQMTPRLGGPSFFQASSSKVSKTPTSAPQNSPAPGSQSYKAPSSSASKVSSKKTTTTTPQRAPTTQGGDAKSFAISFPAPNASSSSKASHQNTPTSRFPGSNTPFSDASQRTPTPGNPKNNQNQVQNAASSEMYQKSPTNAPPLRTPTTTPARIPSVTHYYARGFPPYNASSSQASHARAPSRTPTPVFSGLPSAVVPPSANVANMFSTMAPRRMVAPQPPPPLDTSMTAILAAQVLAAALQRTNTMTPNNNNPLPLRAVPPALAPETMASRQGKSGATSYGDDKNVNNEHKLLLGGRITIPKEFMVYKKSDVIIEIDDDSSSDDDDYSDDSDDE